MQQVTFSSEMNSNVCCWHKEDVVQANVRYEREADIAINDDQLTGN